MEFRILGSFEIVGSAGLVDLRGAKRRGLLVCLVVHAGQPISTDRLVEELWGDGGSPGAARTVQTYVSQLRKLLQGEPASLKTRPGGYVLEVDPDEIDAYRFEYGVNAAGTHADPERQLATLSEALSLWRGPPLREFAGAGWADRETARLDALYLRAQHQRCDTLLELERPREAAEQLELLVDSHPLDETLWAQFMVALYRSGRQADALSAYQQARRFLVDELGIEPGEELVDLEHRILRQDPGLAAATVRAVSLPTGTVTFLFTDLERSTQLWEEQPDEMQVALARHDELLSNAVTGHSGVVVKSTGDGLHAVFPIAAAAVAAAVEAQVALEREQWGAVGALRARMGLHTGAANERAGDYFGPVLNRAARLMSVGHGGQILVSRATEELVRGSLPAGCDLLDLGVHRLRDVSMPVGVSQVVHPELTRAFPPLRVPGASTYNLPVRLSSFVGREQELRTLEKMFVDQRLLTLVGAGGAGKTRLAIELARRVVGSMDDGAWFIDLAPVSEPKAVPSMILDVLGLRDDGRPPLDQTVAFLRDRRALLVFDNCEHLIAIAADAVRSLLSRCPAIAVIATSREPLGIEGETAWRVPSLSVPRRDDPSPEEARESEAVQLFVERARQVQVDFALGADTLADIAEVCRRLDGIPLAIELAAARVRMMSVGQIRDGLTQRFLLLTGGLRTALLRHQTLRASVDWSYDLLGVKERILLARLSVFAGSFTLDSAREVTAGEDVRDVEILDLLAGLVDRSLIQVAERGSLMRYYLLETIRDYAVEQLANAGELDTVRDRHAAFFRSLVETAEPHLEGREQDAWADLLEQERPDLRSAVRWAGVRGDGDTAQRLVAALMWFFVIRAHMREGKALFDVALDTPGGSLATRARAVQARSYLGWHRLEGREAVALANEAAHLARQVGDRRTEARALYVAGFLTGDMGGQRADLEASIALARESGDSWCLAHALGGAGSLGFRDGEGDRGQAFLRESVAVCEALGDSYIINTSRHWLGRSLLASGDRAAGTATLEAVIAHAQAVGDTFSLPMALTSLGLDHAFHGEEALGLAYLDEAAAIARPVGLPRFSQLASALWAKAIVLLAKQDPAAAAVLDEFLVLADRSGGAETKAFACAAVAMAAVLEGDTETADVRLEEARTALSANVPRSARAFVGMVAAAAARARGDFDAAAVYATQALASDPLCAGIPMEYWTIEILETLAGALLAAGAARDAIRLRAAADAERRRILRPRPESYAQDLERDLAIARQRLGGPETDAAWAEGSALPIDGAVAFALNRTV